PRMFHEEPAPHRRTVPALPATSSPVAGRPVVAHDRPVSVIVCPLAVCPPPARVFGSAAHRCCTPPFAGKSGRVCGSPGLSLLQGQRGQEVGFSTALEMRGAAIRRTPWCPFRGHFLTEWPRRGR